MKTLQLMILNLMIIGGMFSISHVDAKPIGKAVPQSIAKKLRKKKIKKYAKKKVYKKMKRLKKNKKLVKKMKLMRKMNM